MKLGVWVASIAVIVAVVAAVLWTLRSPSAKSGRGPAASVPADVDATSGRPADGTNASPTSLPPRPARPTNAADRMEPAAIGATEESATSAAMRVKGQPIILTGTNSHIRMSAPPRMRFLNADLTLGKAAVDELHLTDEERAGVNAALQATRRKMDEAEVAHMVATNLPAGGPESGAQGFVQQNGPVVFAMSTGDSDETAASVNLGRVQVTIPAFPETGAKLRDELYQAIDAAIGQDRSAQLKKDAQFQMDEAFGRFGAAERRITLSVESNAVSGVRYQVTETSPNSAHFSLGGFTSSDSIPERYRHLFEDNKP